MNVAQELIYITSFYICAKLLLILFKINDIYNIYYDLMIFMTIIYATILYYTFILTIYEHFRLVFLLI